MDNIKVTDRWLENPQLICRKTDGETTYNFTKFIFSLKFALKIYCRDLTLQKAKDDQKELKILINKLKNNYNPTNLTKIKAKDDILKSVKILYSIRKEIIDAFKKGVFLYIDELQVEKETDQDTDMTELESEESAAEKRNKQGEGLQILTPSQMLSRLSISLAQLKAGNNSEKLKK